MSAFAGLFFRDNRPATPDYLTPALTHLAPFGSDRQMATADGSAALAHAAHYITPESTYETYPVRGRRGEWLLADARLDNRDELIAALRPENPTERPITDAELIIAAHDKWGNGAPARLIGDFAYALWEAPRRLLHLVRSPYAPKLLFYRVTAEGLCFASFLPALRAIAPYGLTENHRYLANFVTLEMERFHDETVFNEIAKVPHAHGVTWSPDTNRVSTERYWQPALSDQYEGLSDEEWRELFGATFEEAVASRLRSRYPISIAVSGGIDSSAIASIAHRLMYGEGRVAARPTFVYTDRMTGWPDTEEGNYRDLLIATLPEFRAAWTEIPHGWTWEIVERWNRLASSPFNLSSAYWCDYRVEALRADGCRVMLNGAAGDFLAGEEDYYMPEAFYSLPLAQMGKELRYFLHESPRGALKFGKLLAAKHLPPGLFRWIERSRGQPQLYTEKALSDSAGKCLEVAALRGGTRLQREMAKVLAQPLYSAPFEQMGEIMAAHGVEHRYPFYHRPLVELCLNMPHHLRRRAGQTRLLLKEALARDFPPELLQRNSKAGFSRFMAFSPTREDQQRAMTLPPDAVSLRHGWIDRATWQRVAGLPASRPMAVVFAHRIAHMEHWRRCITREQTAEHVLVQPV